MLIPKNNFFSKILDIFQKKSKNNQKYKLPLYLFMNVQILSPNFLFTAQADKIYLNTNYLRQKSIKSSNFETFEEENTCNLEIDQNPSMAIKDIGADMPQHEGRAFPFMLSATNIWCTDARLLALSAGHKKKCISGKKLITEILDINTTRWNWIECAMISLMSEQISECIFSRGFLMEGARRRKKILKVEKNIIKYIKVLWKQRKKYFG